MISCDTQLKTHTFWIFHASKSQHNILICCECYQQIESVHMLETCSRFFAKKPIISIVVCGRDFLKFIGVKSVYAMMQKNKFWHTKDVKLKALFSLWLRGQVETVSLSKILFSFMPIVCFDVLVFCKDRLEKNNQPSNEYSGRWYIQSTKGTDKTKEKTLIKREFNTSICKCHTDHGLQINVR